MSGLFSTFNVGKSGLSVSQRTIDVTSHNIANSNTVGYSRQRADVVASRPMGGNSRGDVVQAGQIGTGAQVEAITRVRDTFLDYQVRGEKSVLGDASIRSQVLSQVESIFNEPSDTGISTLIGKFFDSFQELSKQPQNSNSRTVVGQQTQALTDALNHAYTQLEKLQDNSQQQIKTSVTDVNSLLNQINQLNEQIISVNSTGQSPNDLMDSRDKLLDELSGKFGITVDKKAFDGVDVKPSEAGNMANCNIINASPNSSAARFSYVTSIEADPTQPNTHVITYYKLGDTTSEDNKQTIKVTGLTDNQVSDIKASRTLWGDINGQATKSDGFPIKDGEIITAAQLMTFAPSTGEVSGNISVQKDLTSYMDQLDKLAMSIAFSVNAVHSGMPDAVAIGGNPEKDMVPFFVNKDVAKYDNAGNIINLDSTLEGESKISAKNITINQEIINDVMKIKTKTHDSNYGYTSENQLDGEGDGARALAIAQLRDSLVRIQDFGINIKSRSDLFDSSKGKAVLSNFGMKIQNDTSGTKFGSYYKDTVDTLGVQVQEANRVVTNKEMSVSELENSRDSISGVSIDEEMTNLIQFQHAYSANAKVISTVSELLDVIINGLIK
ncbi:flagellar hook-associated protein FlgK [Clostridium sp. SHJSY1]|uniref:flagellar hook-associated protein FlgK n=1 Tax=Clostridium sp. SHJSY1 TaxID=2942483 RepID=UPI002876EB53|nr:flagellar hook-associated protein FlgK [Clostridium sp. SHJSY1]MDS0524124.1 flagellar hook-associated protein FlgK [Clostridium sp. SHJSY1]